MAVDSHHWAQSSRRRYGAEERRKISAETRWYRGPLSLICFDSCHEWPIAGQDHSPPLRTTFWRGLISVISQWHVKHKKFPDRQQPWCRKPSTVSVSLFLGEFHSLSGSIVVPQSTRAGKGCAPVKGGINVEFRQAVFQEA